MMPIQKSMIDNEKIPKETSFRYERKFLLKRHFINSLKDLVNYTSTDLYEKYEERYVNSIYYDNNDFSLARDSIDGIMHKYKVRIRTYGILQDFNSPKLEIKTKFGKVGKKDIFDINKEELYKHNFLISFLKRIKNYNYFKYDFIQLLKPKLIISYRRKYFLSSCNLFRFTLDSDIKFKIFDATNIKYSLNQYNFFSLNQNILEIKYSINDEVKASQFSRKLPARLSSSSKYLMALDYLGLIDI